MNMYKKFFFIGTLFFLGAVCRADTDQTDASVYNDQAMSDSSAASAAAQSSSDAMQTPPSMDTQAIDYGFSGPENDQDTPAQVQTKLREAAPPPKERPMSTEEEIALGVGLTAAAISAGFLGYGIYKTKKATDKAQATLGYQRMQKDEARNVSVYQQRHDELTKQMQTATGAERDAIQGKLAQVQQLHTEAQQRQTQAAALAEEAARKNTGITGKLGTKIAKTQQAVSKKMAPISKAYQSSQDQAKTDPWFRRK